MKRLTIVLFLLALAGCTKSEPSRSDDVQKPERLAILATTNIVADLVREIAGDAATVEALMGAGVDPHLYKASEGDVRRLQTADVIVYNGLHLEGKLVDILAGLGRQGKQTIALAGGIEPERLLALDDAQNYDPHIWMDAQLWRVAAELLTARLSEVQPHAAPQFSAQFLRYAAELDELHAYVVTRTTELPLERRIMVTAHDAFGYFGRAYGYEVKGLLGVSTAAEPGTADVRELAKFIVTHGVPAIFVESTVSDRYLRALQDAVEADGQRVAIGGQLYSDALGEAGSPSGTYLGMLRHNVDTIVAALRP